MMIDDNGNLILIAMSTTLMISENWKLSLRKMEEWEVDNCARGYHVYESIWAAAMERICIREPLNANDRYVVALKKDGAVVGHLPQKISRICTLFIRRGGTIECIVTGTRRY